MKTWNVEVDMMHKVTDETRTITFIIEAIGPDAFPNSDQSNAFYDVINAKASSLLNLDSADWDVVFTSF